jgi:hypothetical protein
MGRPAGSRNKRTVALDAVFDRLERSREVDPERWVRALDEMATDSKRPDGVRLAAIDKLLRFRYGNPQSKLETTAQIGESWAVFVARLVQSDAGRRNREELEREREARRLTAATVEVVAEERNAS